MQSDDLLPRVREAVAEAGEAIMAVYNDPATTEFVDKEDNSPLTEADLAANRILVERLQALTPDVPILSEESKQAPWSQRKHWRELWVVDPLDGTREFLKRNGEFTVNVALVRDHKPVLGVVYAPALDRWYFASIEDGAWRQDDAREPVAIEAGHKQDDRPWQVVGSRSHNTREVEDFVARLGSAEFVAMGSSLKLCLVADGSAHIYPRLGPTCEWDTCAAQAVVEAAGGQVVNAETGEPLTYNAREEVLNPWFIACREPDRAWFEATTG
ncbi:3'(2'),5'-bisphosphate nucleotidase CysQ [Wenzhouxiangella sp. EGI_FJ10409]|uniref:3'(2'),5'-bisphosphate nucleotidase CysQ n=1 Tax=Wenzhouxiangella sp. EGI_FJ10409 TaxID=3243767 RepID=UPI0035E274F4